MPSKTLTMAKIENGSVVPTGDGDAIVQRIAGKGGWQPPNGETWLPIVVETPVYDRTTHHEVGRGNRVEADRVVRYRIIEPIPVTPDMIKAECQRRIIECTGGGDVVGSLIKQMNAKGAYEAEIARLRAKSNEIEKMNPIPIDFRDDKYWR